jgi:hypothetical protein
MIRMKIRIGLKIEYIASEFNNSSTGTRVKFQIGVVNKLVNNLSHAYLKNMSH